MNTNNLRFEDWLAISDVREYLELEFKNQESEEDCPYCDGDGEHECECGDTHTCLGCNGSGRDSDQLFDFMDYARKVYNTQKAIDDAFLAVYLGNQKIKAYPSGYSSLTFPVVGKEAIIKIKIG